MILVLKQRNLRSPARTFRQGLKGLLQSRRDGAAHTGTNRPSIHTGGGRQFSRGPYEQDIGPCNTGPTIIAVRGHESSVAIHHEDRRSIHFRHVLIDIEHNRVGTTHQIGLKLGQNSMNHFIVAVLSLGITGRRRIVSDTCRDDGNSPARIMRGRSSLGSIPFG
eukprot:scaffold834_cov172-Amphora_coffeaeformis.AAC.5